MIEQAVIKLLSKNRFYASLIMNMRIFYGKKVPTAGVSITDKINLYINPEFWESQTIEQQMDILIHECTHIYRGHPLRQESGVKSGQKLKLWRMAVDVHINEPLKSLHEMGVTFEKLEKELGVTISRNETAEYYYSLLKEYSDSLDDEFMDGSTIDDHDVWDEVDDIPQEIQENTLRKTLESAVENAGGIGNCPSEVRQILHTLNKSNINWQQQLRQFFAKCDKFLKESSRKKRNRRYGTMFSGKKKIPKLVISCVNDESGSVSEHEFNQFYSEIDKIKSLYQDSLDIYVVNCDTKVNKVYKYEKNLEIERTGQGGTQLQPGIEKSKELAVDGIIVFSDGGIWNDEYNDVGIPTLWAITQNFDTFDPPFGKKIHVKCGEE